MDGHPGSSAACACLLCVSHGFHGQNFLLRCCRVSVLDAIPSCVRTSLSTRQGGGFAFCLMSVSEEAILGPGPVFPASVAKQREFE